MKLLLSCTVVLVLIHNSLFAQPADTGSFAQYSNETNTQLVAAYTAKDANAYERLLQKYLATYNQLPDSAKTENAPYLAGFYYNFACTYALLNNKQKALGNLEKSIALGYADFVSIQKDADLAILRTDPLYKKMISRLRATHDPLLLLQRAGKYDKTHKIDISFTYQQSNTPELMALRQSFKLDSVAGFGNEVSRLINLLHWVHNMVPHNGQVESGIKQINALEILKVAADKKIGVSCGELATVLNEVYLAMGWKSRKVYCFPKDSLKKDYDSHVINTVYAASLKKWVWMDPTNDAYVMNEKGELLSIEEVRGRLVALKPLILNPDANWNRRSSAVADHYLYQYMAKNLYRLYSPLSSEYNLETWGQNKTVSYVHLLPLDYKVKRVDKEEYFNKGRQTTFVHYSTTNPEIFWKAPQED